MKGYGKYIIVLVLLFGTMLAIELSKPTPINWSETFSKDDKIPYGTYILFNELNTIGGDNKVIVKKETPYEYIDDAEELTEGKSNLIIIQSSGFIDEYEWEKLYKYAERGNNVFISSTHMNDDLLDTFGIESEYYGKTFEKDTALKSNFVNPRLKDKQGYFYSFKNYFRYFSDVKSGDIKILGVLQDTLVEFIECKAGQGKIYLHSNPKAFANINMVKDNNYQYAFRALSYLPPRPIIWDEFYKRNIHSRETRTPLKYILSQPAFRWGYYTLLVGLLLFFIFRAKRQQKAIPVIKPLENTSLEFTETIGRLYYNRADHHDIANKKILYFLQYVLTRYQLRYKPDDMDFVKRLTEKSGIPERDVKYLIWKITNARANKNMEAEELWELNNKIDEFYEKAK